MATGFSYPVRRFSIGKASDHFLRPQLCTCVEHKAIRLYGEFSNKFMGFWEYWAAWIWGSTTGGPETRRATDIVRVFGGEDQDADISIELRTSAIAGIGAFAKRDLTRHTTIGEYMGERILSRDVLNIRRGEYDRGQIGDYIFEVEEDRLWIDATFTSCAV